MYWYIAIHQTFLLYMYVVVYVHSLDFQLLYAYILLFAIEAHFEMHILFLQTKNCNQQVKLVVILSYLILPLLLEFWDLYLSLKYKMGIMKCKLYLCILVGLNWVDQSSGDE